MALVSSPKPGDDVSVRQAIQKLGSTKLGVTSTPTFLGVTTTTLTISGLTTNSLIYPVAGLLTSLGAATDGQLPIGDTGSVPVLATITQASANQVRVVNAAGSITLSTPQDIHAGATNFIVAGGSFTGVFSGISPTAGEHLATKEYVDLAIGTEIDFFLSNTASGVGSAFTIYAHDTGEAQSTIDTTTDYPTGLGTGDNQLIFSFLTEVGQPGIKYLRDGVYDAHAHLHRSAGNKPTSVYWTLSYVDADGSSNETLVVTGETSGALTGTPIPYDLHAVLTP